MSTHTGKVPPQAVDLEKKILGGMMTEKMSLIEAVNIVSVNSFYTEPHQKIFKAIDELFNSNKPVDLMTVVEKLTKNGDIDFVGGAYYVSELTASVSYSGAIEEHCYILVEKELKRKQIFIGQNLVSRGYDETESALDINDYLSEQTISAATLVDFSSTKSNADTLSDIRQRILSADKDKGLTGVPTGIVKADQIFGGYQKSDLIIKASRPSMGKTAHALCEALHAAIESKKNVVFFSLEMSKGQLMTRLVCILASIDSEKIKKGNLSLSDWNAYDAAEAKLVSENLIIIDDLYSIGEITNKSKKIKIETGVDIIFVDYLQLVSGNKKGNREQEISGISRSLKMLAKSIDVPVVALSQLSRSLETRGGDKRPMLSDLRESGAIEQDADIVTFLYRPSYYGITEDHEGTLLDKGYTLLIIAKHRSGGLEDVEMNFVHRFTRFENTGVIQEETQGDIQPNTEFEDRPF